MLWEFRERRKGAKLWLTAERGGPADPGRCGVCAWARETGARTARPWAPHARPPRPQVLRPPLWAAATPPRYPPPRYRLLPQSPPQHPGLPPRAQAACPPAPSGLLRPNGRAAGKPLVPKPSARRPGQGPRVRGAGRAGRDEPICPAAAALSTSGLTGNLH